MPSLSPHDVRRIDRVAVNAAVRRMAAAEQPPWLHREVARRMSARLQWIQREPSEIVDWSAFLGAGNDLLQAAYPKARRTLIEPTPELCRRSEALSRKPWWRRPAPEVRVQGAAEAGDGRRAQLIWSNMALHAADDPPAWMARWQRMLSPDGFLMFSCLGPGTLESLRTLYREAGWSAPTIDFVDMHDLGDMLVGAGFADPVMDQETLTLTWPDAQACLTELRSLGGNASPDRFAGLRSRRWRQALLDRLDAQRVDGRVQLRFEVTYGHAFQPLAPRASGGETAVPLEDMRALLKSGRRPG